MVGFISGIFLVLVVFFIMITVLGILEGIPFFDNPVISTLFNAGQETLILFLLLAGALAVFVLYINYNAGHAGV